MLTRCRVVYHGARSGWRSSRFVSHVCFPGVNGRWTELVWTSWLLLCRSSLFSGFPVECDGKQPNDRQSHIRWASESKVLHAVGYSELYEGKTGWRRSLLGNHSHFALRCCRYRYLRNGERQTRLWFVVPFEVHGRGSSFLRLYARLLTPSKWVVPFFYVILSFIHAYIVKILSFVCWNFPAFFHYSMSENTFRILVATDNHLGYKYHPPTRC